MSQSLRFTWEVDHGHLQDWSRKSKIKSNRQIAHPYSLRPKQKLVTTSTSYTQGSCHCWDVCIYLSEVFSCIFPCGSATDNSHYIQKGFRFKSTWGWLIDVYNVQIYKSQSQFNREIQICDRGNLFSCFSRQPYTEYKFRSLTYFPLCFCRMNKKREVFQNPADMSPAETGNPTTRYDGLAY